MTISETATPILFVCLGNICRSPLAEGVFASMAAERGLADRYEVDSAGTAGYHSGEAPDPRSVAVAAKHGIRLVGAARQVTRADLARPGLVVAMDASNRRSLERLRGPGEQAEIVTMRDFDPDDPGGDVPDPYYGGPGGFDDVYEILHRSCRGLLDELVQRVPGD